MSEQKTNNLININDVIEVNGFIMLQKMNGVLKLIEMDEDTYTFAKGKNGVKPFVRHYKKDIDSFINEGFIDEEIRNCNYISILNK